MRGAVLFLLDTVRADHVSCAGYERDTTPNLAKLADGGVVFEDTVAEAPWTLPSVRTILSARWVDRAAASETQLSASVVDSIRRAGFVTEGITEGGYVSKVLGFGLGFDEYVEEEGVVQLVRPDKPRESAPKGGIANTFRRAKEWLSAHRDKRFFLMIHTYEPHAPHDRLTFARGFPPAHFGKIFTIETGALLHDGRIPFDDDDLRYLAALYDGGVFESDKYVGDFLAFMDQLGLRDRTLVVVTSDHGEEMGDHYRPFSGNHGHSLHDELLRVPLVIHDPLRGYPVRRVRSQVRAIDVLPTIADILGARIDFSTDGASLLPIMEGRETGGRVAWGGVTKYGPHQMFLRHRGFKYIVTTRPAEPDRWPVLPTPAPVQLYDLARDPRERVNLAASRPEIVRDMQELLDSLRTRTGPAEPDSPRPDQVDDRLRERLRSLGYVR